MVSSSPTELWCGVDVGTQGVRATVVDATGHVHGEWRTPLPAGRRQDGRHEQDPGTWWDALVAAVGAAVAASSAAGNVVAVALDGTSGTVVVEDADGRACGPALMYDDGRATAEADRAARVGAQVWDRLGYRMQPTWALPKILWLHQTGAFSAGRVPRHQTDHLVRRLTGNPVATDLSNALKTGADQEHLSWPAAVTEGLGLAGLLPDLVLPGDVLGGVSREAAEATGLPVGCVVRAGMTDGCASQIAAGALAVGSWSSTLGTTLVVKGVTAELIRDPAGSVYCHRHPDGGWLPGGASSTGAGALTAFADNERLGGLTAAAAAAPPAPGTTYPLIGTGERFPFVAPGARGFTDAPPSTDEDWFVAVCQGVAYVERLAYDVLGRLGADVDGDVALTGGGARNGWWNQLRTDVLGRPTYLPASPEASFGMAVLAAAPRGQLTATASAMVRRARTYVPDPDRGARLRPGYERLLAALSERGWLDRDVADAIACSSLPPTGPAFEVLR